MDGSGPDLGLHVGPGDTRAAHRLRDPESFARVLSATGAARIVFAPRPDYANAPFSMEARGDELHIVGTSDPIVLSAPGVCIPSTGEYQFLYLGPVPGMWSSVTCRPRVPAPRRRRSPLLHHP